MPIALPFVAQSSLAACRLELDISTNQSETIEIEREMLEATYRELVKAGRDIATIGDKP